MEKFSQWRDAATGVAPFLPLEKFAKDTSSFVIGIEVISATILGLVKAVLAVTWAGSYFAILQWIPVLQSIGLKVLLLLCGVYSAKMSFEDAKRGSKQNISWPKAGDVVVSNFVSPLDSLIYSTLMKATFVIPQPGALKYQRISCWKVFFKALSLPSSEEPDSTFEELEKIVQISKASGSVVVIFAEGTTSNSRGLLPFANQLPFCSIPSSSTIFPTALKYTPPTITTPVPTNIFIWLFKLFGELQGVSVLVKFGHRVGVDPAKPNNESLTKEICDNICLSGKLRRVGLGIESKRSFVEAWNRKR